MTGNDLINSALRLIRVLAAGEIPDAAESADALFIANQMVEEWTAQELLIFTLNINEFVMTAGQQVYTLGTGGDFNIPRPAKIERMGIVSLNNPAQPLELPLEMMTDKDWSEVPVKNVQGALPLYVYDDGAFPLRNLSFWTVPSVHVNVRIYSWSALTQFPDLASDVEFPPGYAKAIRYNLAVDLAPEFGVPCPPEVINQAIITKGNLKSINTPIVQARCDPAVVSPSNVHYDYRSDTYVGK